MRDENEICCLKYDSDITMFADIRLRDDFSDSFAPATAKPIVSKANNGEELRIEKWVHDVPYAIFGKQQKNCDFGLIFIMSTTIPEWMHCNIFINTVDAALNTENAQKIIDQLIENMLAIKLQDGVSYANETEDMADAAESLCEIIINACESVKDNYESLSDRYFSKP